MTEQERFWMGEFGDAYTVRNSDATNIANNTALFARVLKHMQEIGSILEIGCGAGMNLAALKTLLPASVRYGIDINGTAIKAAQMNDTEGRFYRGTIETERLYQFDFVFTKGLLIHVDPDKLVDYYKRIYELSGRYILFCEYYNPYPVETDYRGHKAKLFKRDFAGEFMDTVVDVDLIDYGFVYHGDKFYQDDLTWFLMEKWNA